MKFILISGKSGHGKDTAAKIIREEMKKRDKTSLVIHYADLLKHICKIYFGWDGNKDKKGRDLLQSVGTDRIRNINPDFWVNFILSLVKFFPDTYDYIIIPDLRFPNEINRIKEEGYDVCHVRIVRENYNSTLDDSQQLHISETAMDDIKPDFWIFNNDIELFAENVRNFINYYTEEI